MAQVLRFFDSFDHYADAQLLSKWTTAEFGPSFDPSIGVWGRNGSNGFRTTMGGSNFGMRLTIPGGANQEIIIGCAYKYETTANVPLIWIFRDSSVPQMTLAMDANLKVLTVWKNRDALNDGTLVATGTRVLQPSTWYSIEVYCKVATSGGRFVVAVNELTDIDYTGNTNASGNAWTNQIEFAGTRGGTGGTRYLDDVFVASGGSAFYGDCRAEALFPNSDGSRTDFTPSSGSSHYQMVDETPPNEDTDYNKSLTVGHKDSYQFSDPSPTSATVKGIQYVPRARTDDEGTRTIKSFYRSPSGNEYESPNSLGLSSSYSIPVGDIVELNPETGNAWTIQDLKDAQFGLKVQA